MESNNISAEIAEPGDNSLGCSLKNIVEACESAGDGSIQKFADRIVGNHYDDRADYAKTPWGKPAHSIRQYMKSKNPCEKDVSNPEPFPSILESSEQARRVERNREIEFVRQSICGLIAQ
jgi:hypothetical protein